MKPGRAQLRLDRAHRVTIQVGVVVAVALVGGQLLAPPIAASLLRHRLAKDGKALSVHVSAFPWLQLLWQHADEVTATMASYRAEPGKVKSMLGEVGGIGKLDLSIGIFHTGLLTLRHVSLTKRTGELVGVAELELKDLQAALPMIQSLTPVHDDSGQLVLRGTASVLGVRASVDAVVAARDGKLVVAPTGLLGAFAAVTLYDDPMVHVQSVRADTVAGGVRFVAVGKLT